MIKSLGKFKMKKLLKGIGKQCLIIFILTLLVVFSYGVVHELTHYMACESVGLKGNITINLLVDPPVYSMNCQGINEKSNLSKFLFWGSPYIISLIIMILFFFYLNKKRFYLVALPLGIAFNDAMNIFGLYEWTFRTGELGNDLLNILYKTPRIYYYIIFVMLGLTICFFIFNLFKFYKEYVKSLKPKTSYFV